jgi:hypothetical protein
MASSERTKGAEQAATEAGAQTGAQTGAEAGTASGSHERFPDARPAGADRAGRASGAAPSQTAIDGIRCDLLMNARYHASREAFLDTVHRSLMFLIIVLGAAAITDLLNAPWIKGAFAACAVLFAAFDLTADLSNRARCHALMKRRYFELLADLTSGQKNPIDVEAHMHRCSADEEPAFHALLAVSWNAAQEMVFGTAADAYDIPRHHRFLKNIRRYGQAKYSIMQGPRPATA